MLEHHSGNRKSHGSDFIADDLFARDVIPACYSVLYHFSENRLKSRRKLSNFIDGLLHRLRIVRAALATMKVWRKRVKNAREDKGRRGELRNDTECGVLGSIQRAEDGILFLSYFLCGDFSVYIAENHRSNLI